MAKSRKEFNAGVNQLKQFWESKIDKHMEEVEKKSKPTPVGVASAIVVQLLAIGFANFIIWLAKPSSSIFSWHPTMMTLGFMVLMMEAIVIFSPWFSVGLGGSSHNGKVFYHWVLQVCGLVCAYIGLGVISYNKFINGYPHYTSWHGFMGILVCCSLAVQACGGIIELYPTALPFKVRKVILKRLHAFSGTVTFAGAMITLFLSLYSNWFLNQVSNVFLWTALAACPILILVIVIGQFGRNHISLMFRRN